MIRSTISAVLLLAQDVHLRWILILTTRLIVMMNGKRYLLILMCLFCPCWWEIFMFCVLHRRILVRVFLTVRRMVMKLWKKIPKLQMKMKIALLCLMAISRTMRYNTKRMMSHVIWVPYWSWCGAVFNASFNQQSSYQFHMRASQILLNLLWIN